MDIKKYIKEYIPKCKIMQIATVGKDGPWICNVHFVEDGELNLYWLSLPTRRHSKEIEINPHIAIAIVIKPDKPVVGIQSEGVAEVVQDAEVIKQIMKKYTEKYDIGGQFYDNFVNGKNQHNLYKFTPKNFVLFDEVNFKNNPRQEVST